MSGPMNDFAAKFGPMIVFRLVGLIFVMIGLYFAWDVMPYLVSGRRVEGTVIEIKERRYAQKASYWPVVEYQLDGKTYRVESPLHESYPTWQVGQSASVLYLPGDPGRGRVDSLLETFLFPGVFIGIGVVFTFARFGRSS